TLVGRSAACLVVLDDPRVSAEHAAITWSGEHWELRDLGSLNGTWVDGRRLSAGERALMHRDARLAFAGGEPWVLSDAQPAGPAARNETTGELVQSSALLALPSPDDPRATIFRRSDGQWLAELGSELRAIGDRGRLEIDGVPWLVFLPDELGALTTTLEARGTALVLADLTLC